MTEDYYTIQQVARLLQVDDGTIYRYLKLGKLKSIKIGRLHRIPAAEIDFLLNGKESV